MGRDEAGKTIARPADAISIPINKFDSSCLKNEKGLRCISFFIFQFLVSTYFLKCGGYAACYYI